MAGSWLSPSASLVVGAAYWSLSNEVSVKERTTHPDRDRNTLALIRSANLRDWEVRAVVLRHPDALKHAFQYADWQFDGGDLVAVSRTAFDDGVGGAENQHDANFLTFHRIQNFRELTSDILGATNRGGKGTVRR